MRRRPLCAAGLLACLALLSLVFAGGRAASVEAAQAPVLTIFFTADTKGYFDPCPT
ncbi:hypothetical protein JCM14635_22010 [Megalodesulfovibrio paquesii]